MKYLIRILVFVLLSGPLAAGEIQVSTDFSGGSAEVLEIDQEKRIIRLNPTRHKDRGWTCWWYLKVSGIEPGETLTLDVGNAPWATPDRAMYSLDNEEWLHSAPGNRDGKRIVYQQTINSTECWFAWGPPFTEIDAKQLVEDLAKRSPHAEQFELCRTRAGRSVPALVVKQKGVADEKRKGIWIQARQHAWEAGSSWVCRGFAEWLVSEDPRAVALRQQAVVTIVPVMDIDNVAIGAGGKNQKPRDHNRDWSDDPYWNSVREAQKQILKMSGDGRFDLFVDLHNPGAGRRDPYFYIPPKESLSEIGLVNLNRFLTLSRLELTGPLRFRGKAQESGANYTKAWANMGSNWVSENTADHVVAVTLETAWNTPNSTVEGYKTVGRQLGRTIARYIQPVE